jgi:hypothetical protein
MTDIAPPKHFLDIAEQPLSGDANFDVRGPSSLEVWHNAGGRITADPTKRRANLDLFPYINASQGSVLNYTSMVYAFLLLLCGVFSIWFIVKIFFFGPGERPTPPYFLSLTATASLMESSSSPAVLAQVEVTQEVASPARLRPAAEVAQAILPTLPPRATYTPQFSPTPSPSPTATFTETPLPTATITPTLTSTPVCERCQTMPLQVQIAWFYPPLGDLHCPEGVANCERLLLSSGDPWFTLQGAAAACPDQFPLRSWVEVPGLGVYHCLHRLPLATCDFATGACVILVLSSEPVVDDWRQQYPATLWYP